MNAGVVKFTVSLPGAVVMDVMVEVGGAVSVLTVVAEEDKE